LGGFHAKSAWAANIDDEPTNLVVPEAAVNESAFFGPAKLG
jgi:hypothetical protein